MKILKYKLVKAVQYLVTVQRSTVLECKAKTDTNV